LRFRNLSKEQKLRLAIMVVACGLVFYAVGIATNFFGLPIFSMFFIISYNTAHDVVTYMAITAAVALTLITLLATIMKRRKVEMPQVRNRPVFRTVETPHQASTRVRMPTSTLKMTDTLKMTGSLESSNVKQETQQATKPVIKTTERLPVQTANQPSVVKDSKISQVDINEKMGKFVCPVCKKEFSTPLFTLEYVESIPKLIKHCPYCDHRLG